MTGIGSPARYEVYIQGVVDAAWFEGLRVVSDGRRTAVSGLLPDQPRYMACWSRSATSGCASSVCAAWTGQSSNRDKERCAVVGQSAVETLRAFGFDASADGLGNVFAHVWKRT
jgi:hypothetical protein